MKKKPPAKTKRKDIVDELRRQIESLKARIEELEARPPVVYPTVPKVPEPTPVPWDEDDSYRPWPQRKPYYPYPPYQPVWMNQQPPTITKYEVTCRN